MEASVDLVLFTSGFPYDGSESVLGSELEVTAERFRRVFLIPSRRGSESLSLPANVSVVDLGWTEGWDRPAKLRVLRSLPAVRVMASSLRYPANWTSYARGARSYLDILATNLLKAQGLRRWIAQEGLRDAIFYDYWFENATLALAMLRTAGAVRCAVSRAHRFDIFDASWEGMGRVPFREYKARNLDAVFAVSEDGAEYLREHFGRYAAKVAVGRLGISLPAVYPEGGTGPPLIVSCSTLLKRKQVHMIPAVLSQCRRPIRWIHLGDGPERDRVEAAARSLPSNVAWELRGWVDNRAVRDFYATNRVTAFLSLSTSEGIPVSMMEAQSVGIPIVARDVGGISELVTSRTGRLVSADASVAEVAEALARAIYENSFDRGEIRAAFAARYEAFANYAPFADQLLDLWASCA